MLKRLWRNFREMFKPPAPVVKAQGELVEAQLRLLEAQTALEWAKTTVEYNTHRIKRLTEYINQEEKRKLALKTAKKATRA